MRTLTEALKEYIVVGIVNEGGNVWDNSAPIKKEYCILDPNTLQITGFTIDPTEISWIDVTELFNKSNPLNF